MAAHTETVRVVDMVVSAGPHDKVEGHSEGARPLVSCSARSRVQYHTEPFHDVVELPEMSLVERLGERP